MAWLKGFADIVGRILHFLVAAPEIERPLTEDDIRSDRYLRRQPAPRHHAAP